MDTDDDDIAIVGIGCRFPGAENIDEFWKVLVNGENHVIEIPPERWNLDQHYDSNKDTPGKTYARRAGLIKNFDEWDNRFYGISDVEAERMDPQHKYVLDCVHMALEDGGFTKRQIAASDTGVYIGAMNDDYRSAWTDGWTDTDNYTLTGSSPSILPARVSYVYNLLGPSMTIDTACSAALVAIHVASQAIRTGDCSMAICGGVNCILYPEMFVQLSKARMLSPTGQSKAFSVDVDGYARGEGCGIVILKRMKEAISDGNKILAQITTGCNQDGRIATPMTAPSGEQQEQLLKKIYSGKDIKASDVQFIEAHGTGTPVGDPVEANALNNFFGQRKNNGRIYLGSVKTNIGHLESAAGVAGLIKILLMMKHGKIVPSLFYSNSNQNPKINFDSFVVPTEVVNWIPLSNMYRIACVNSFGFGGTNSHAVIKQVLRKNCKIKHTPKFDKSVVAVSAMDPFSLKLSLKDMVTNLETNIYDIHEIAYTSTLRRDHYAFRNLFVAATTKELLEKSRISLMDDQYTRTESNLNIVFVFCGVGTTWPGMCQKMLSEESVFRKAIEEIDKHLKPLANIRIAETLKHGFSSDDPFLNHIAIFACQVGLAAVWRKWGVTPNAIVGQSIGEVAASFYSGLLSIEDAVKVIFNRSSVLEQATGGKMMVVANISTDKIANICREFDDMAEIAVYTSPSSCVVTGETAAINQIKGRLKQLENGNQLFIKELPVRCAYHSRHVNEASNLVEVRLQDLQRNVSGEQYPIISSVRGNFAGKEDFVTAKYWKDNIRKPVLFSKAIETSSKSNMLNIYLEIGPKPVLKTHIDKIFPDGNVFTIPSMTVDSGKSMMLESLAKLYEKGVNPIWENIVTLQSNITDIPRYKFQTRKNFFEPVARSMKNQGMIWTGSSHMFIEREFGGDVQFRINVSPEKTPFVYQHFASGFVTIPDAFYAEIGLEIGKQTFKEPLQSITVYTDFIHSVRLNEKQSRLITAKIESNSEQEIQVNIKDGNEAVARCIVKKSRMSSAKSFVDTQRIKKRCNVIQSAEITYRRLQNQGFSYGDGIKILGNAIRNEKECLIEINLPDMIMKDLKDTNIHPCILDGLLQTPGAFTTTTESGEKSFRPVMVGYISSKRPPAQKMYGYSVVVSESDIDKTYNAMLLTVDGLIVLEVKRYVTLKTDTARHGHEYDFGKIIWKPLIREKDQIWQCQNKESRRTLIISYTEEDGQKLTKCLENHSLADHIIISKINEEMLKDRILQFCIEHEANSIFNILFLPGRMEDDQQSGEKVLSRTLETSRCFLQLIKLIQAKAQTIPIFLVTEATQELERNRYNKKNIFGSELWGFTRSVLRESNIRILLIDVFPGFEANLNELRDVLLRPPTVSELAICNGSLMVSEFITFLGEENELKLVSCHRDEMCKVEYRSRHHEKIDSPFFLLNETRPSAPGDYTVMHTETACVHNQDLFPLCNTAFEDVTVWPEDKPTGYNVLTLEVKGYVSGDNSCNAFKGAATNKRVEEDLSIGCFPVNVSNYVAIPTKCVCSLTDMPFYIPGLLTTLCLLWSITRYIDKNHDVCVIVKNKDSVAGKLLLLMLKQQKKRRISIVVEECIENEEIDSFQAVVLLDTIDSNTKKVLVTKLSKDSDLISIRPILPLDVVRTFRFNIPGMKIISVETDAIFHQTNLIEIIPKLKSWMNSEEIRQELVIIKSKLKLSSLRVSDGDIIPLGCQILDLKFDKTCYNHKPDLCLPEAYIFRRNACYIVVGGLTGLGWEILKFLVKHKAGCIVTMSRRLPSKSKLREIENIEETSGSKILALCVDLCDMISLEKAIADISVRFPNMPIKGIFQGAAVLKDAFFFQMTEDQLKDVYLPKIQGTWNLHLISQHMSLDFFIMHSSFTSVLGNLGQSNYGAANAFMDTLAHYRRSTGLCGQSINWGPLSVGLAVDDANVQDELRKRGYKTLNIDEIHMSLEEALRINYPQFTIGNFDWKIIIQDTSQTDTNFKCSRFATIANSVTRSVSLDSIDLCSSDNNRAWIKILEGSQEMISLRCVELVQNIASQVFAFDPSAINEETSVLSLGIDSMLALTFGNKLFEATGITLPLTGLLVENMNISQIAEYILQNSNNSTVQL